MLFIDGDGKVVYKAAGLYESKNSSSIAKEAVNPEKYFRKKQNSEVWSERRKDPEFLMGLIKNTYSTDFHWLKKWLPVISRREQTLLYSKEEAGMLLFSPKPLMMNCIKSSRQKRQNFLHKIPESYLAEYDKQLLNTVLQKSFDANTQSINEQLFSWRNKIYGEKEAKQLLNKINMDLFLLKKYDDMQNLLWIIIKIQRFCHRWTQ